MSNGNAGRYKNYHGNSNLDALITLTTVTHEMMKIQELTSYTKLVRESYLCGLKQYDVFDANVPHYDNIQHVRDMFHISKITNGEPVCTAVPTKLLVDGKWVYNYCDKEFHNRIVLCEKPREVTRSAFNHQSEYCGSKKQLYFNSRCYRLQHADDGLSSDCLRRFHICDKNYGMECHFVHVMLTKWNKMLTNQVGFSSSGQDDLLCIRTMQSKLDVYDFHEWRRLPCNPVKPEYWLCVSQPVSFTKRLVSIYTPM